MEPKHLYLWTTPLRLHQQPVVVYVLRVSRADCVAWRYCYAEKWQRQKEAILLTDIRELVVVLVVVVVLVPLYVAAATVV